VEKLGLGVSWSDLHSALPTRRGNKRLSKQKKWEKSDACTTDNVSFNVAYRATPTRSNTAQCTKEAVHIQVMEGHASKPFLIVVFVINSDTNLILFKKRTESLRFRDVVHQVL